MNDEIKLGLGDCFAGVTAQCCSIVRALQSLRAELLLHPG